MDEYYLQDSRDYVGNNMLFWRKEGRGYTTNLLEAEVYTRQAAFAQNACRETDIPWLKSYIDSKARPAVDFQYCKRDEEAAAIESKSQS